MRRVMVMASVVVFSAVSLAADVTVTQTMTMTGQAAAMMQGAPLPKITMRIKGRKARSDMDMNGQTITSITDLDARQVILLNSATKTATVSTPESVAAGGAGVPMPKLDISLTPTGKSQTIDGQACDEHSFSMTLAMGDMMGQRQMPPEAAEALKDVRMRMNGSFWIAKSAPGASEFAAFSKAAAQSNLLSAVTGAIPGMSGGLDKLMEAMATASGLPYLTEMTMTVEGSGPMVEAMKQMGGFTMVQKIESVSTTPISDDLFRIPEGYTIEK